MPVGARAGARFGPYEVVSLLGAGGMGEVYRARDTRLDRDVAIKVLPEQAASDPSRLKRFEKEARASSALSHPNIVTIHEVDCVDSTTFIVMELVEGKTLRELLAEGAMPSRRLIPIAVQIADGLARAHASGIVHRDLKPENVMVTGDGLVKILDFGLAKLAHPEREAGQPLESATVSQATQPGIAVGTVFYMSPEQACGYPVDFRSDQFSFGSILYEMVTGQRPFEKKTGPETMAAIIRDDPRPIATLAPESPAPLRWIAERCLSKEPKERYASTEDLAKELQGLRIHLSEISTPAGGVAELPPPRRKSRLAAALVLPLLALGVLTGGLFVGLRLGKRPPPSYHELTYKSGFLSAARFAPDGRTLVYSARWSGDPLQAFVLRPDPRADRRVGGGFDSVPLGPAGAAVLAVSPKGEVALALDCKNPASRRLCSGTLATILLGGGIPREISAHIHQADWSTDGSGMAVVSQIGDASRLEFPPGKVLWETKGNVSYPRFSPRGDRIAFFDHARANDDRARLAVVDLSGKKRDLTPEMNLSHGLAWSPSGDEIWFTANWPDEDFVGIQAITLSGKRRLIARAPERLRLHDVFRDGRALVSEDVEEWKVFALGPGESRERDMTWMKSSFPAFLSRDGKTLVLGERFASTRDGYTFLRRTDGSPVITLGEAFPISLSPDGKWVLAGLFGHRQGLDAIELIPTGAGENRRLTYEGIEEYLGGAAFFPDGKEILFRGRRGQETRFYRGSLDGGVPRPALPSAAAPPVSFSSDGRRLLARSRGVPAVFSLDTNPDDPPRPIPETTAEDMPVAWSEDESSVYLQNQARVFRVDVETGRRALWKEIVPGDPSGATIGRILITPDGKFYAYGIRRDLSKLYLVEGLR